MSGGSIDPYEALGNAVVLQAVKDFRAAYRVLKRHPDDPSAQRDVKELIRFFTSPHFNIFTSLDGEMIVNRLMKEMEEGR